MKKMLSIICITILLFLNLITTTYANVDFNLKAPTMVAKDQEFKITVESASELIGVGFILTYDESLIEYVRVEGGTEDINAANQSIPGEVKVVFASTEVPETPYTIVFKALKDNKTVKIGVKQVELVVKDETAELGMKEETGVRVEDLKIKLVKESELVEGEQTIGRSNSLLIYIIIGVVAVVVIIVIVLLVLKKKKKK